jgi:SulP family sulfate permease
MPSLMFGNALISLGLVGASELSSVAPMLSLYIGLFLFVFFLLGLERLTILLPPALMSAFATSGAILSFMTQVKTLFGIPITSDDFVQVVVQFFQLANQINVATLLLSLASIGIMLLTKYVLEPRVLRRWRLPDPGAILVVVLGVVLQVTLDLKHRWGVSLVGPTPAGLPPPLLPWSTVPGGLQGQIAVHGLVIAVISYALMISVVKSLAKKSNSVTTDRKELGALAVANIFGSFFGAEVISASFSGSAVTASLKVTSLMHNFVNAVMMALILLAATPVIQLMPKCTLSAVIVCALPSLMDFREPVRLARVKLDDLFIWAATFAVTIFAGVIVGFCAGIAAVLIVIVRVSVGADCTELGVLPNTSIYRSLQRFPAARRMPGVGLYRLDASVGFANHERLEARLGQALEKLEPGHTLILDMVAVNNIDNAGITMLCGFAKQCELRRVRLFFSGWNARVRFTLYAAHDRWLRESRKIDSKRAATSDIDSKRAATSDIDSKRAATSDIEAPGHGTPPPLNKSLAPYAFHTVARVEPTNGEPAVLDPSAWFLSLHDAVLRVTQKGAERAGRSERAKRAERADELRCASTENRCDGTTTERLPRGESREWTFVQQGQHEIGDDVSHDVDDTSHDVDDNYTHTPNSIKAA